MCLRARGLIQSAEEPGLFLSLSLWWFSRRGLFVSPPREITAVITNYIPSLVVAGRADKKSSFRRLFYLCAYSHVIKMSGRRKYFAPQADAGGERELLMVIRESTLWFIH